MAKKKKKSIIGAILSILITLLILAVIYDIVGRSFIEHRRNNNEAVAHVRGTIVEVHRDRSESIIINAINNWFDTEWRIEYYLVFRTDDTNEVLRLKIPEEGYHEMRTTLGERAFGQISFRGSQLISFTQFITE
ncbi:MAG: hypothetical protein FWD82_07380 [Defluviitaleaceae bacterium]|nr:hypothetical protein [Defluviitaleaceae bacterium]